MLPNQIAGRMPRGQQEYFGLSSQPLHILIFLLPIILAYEIGSMGLLDGEGGRLVAQKMLVQFFDLFGVLGLHLPALALVITLGVQHFLSRASWRVVPMVPLAMIVESAFLTGPLIILWLIVSPQGGGFVQDGLMQAGVMQAGVMQAEEATRGGVAQGVLMSLGAGLYEEMLFRLVMITILHFLVTDVMGFKDKTGKVFAVVCSAAAFAWFHNAIHTTTGLDIRLALFLTLAGVYFGVLFLARGLGIAVGVHLIYDLLAIVIIPGIQGES
mgnify:CR=1 FL=1